MAFNTSKITKKTVRIANVLFLSVSFFKLLVKKNRCFKKNIFF